VSLPSATFGVSFESSTRFREMLPWRYSPGHNLLLCLVDWDRPDSGRRGDQRIITGLRIERAALNKCQTHHEIP
jgi:hypothetical protein